MTAIYTTFGTQVLSRVLNPNINVAEAESCTLKFYSSMVSYSALYFANFLKNAYCPLNVEIYSSLLH